MFETIKAMFSRLFSRTEADSPPAAAPSAPARAEGTTLSARQVPSETPVQPAADQPPTADDPAPGDKASGGGDRSFQ